MLKKIKRKILQEVINELWDFCKAWDLEREVKQECGDNVTFELGVGAGLRRAIGLVCDMRDRYE